MPPLRNREARQIGEKTMPGYPTVNAANHASPEWPADLPCLTDIVRDLVGYTLEDVERELILNSLDQYEGCRTYTANVLGISIRCLRNKIAQYAAMGIPIAAPGQRDDLRTAGYLPDCLSCGQPMRLERPTTQVRGMPRARVFACKPCGLAVTADDASLNSPARYLHS
jgi:hypothetical protein